ncbi:MAG: KUP/HAK/KT family potassium transporter [Desulfobacterales bacterium]|nr:KUP/HAK/KT family potassium transporter [Desulfobacterales bacterium]
MPDVHETGSDACLAPQPSDLPPHRKPDEKTAALALGALGVVYGDIGTSPLYAVRECFNGPHAVELNAVNLLGVASLIFWSLIIVVSIKYVGFIIRADNRGEGGIFALLGLILGTANQLKPKLRSAVTVAAIFGASLLYGEGIITPSISVLSAIEGLEVATEAAKPFIVPLTCMVLVGLFVVQKRGTSGIGKIFGPVMVIWFLTIAAAGTGAILQSPRILTAVNPWHAWNFFSVNHLHGFVVLGSVVLCITGSEALYADLGHFGARAIRMTWLGIACPALLLNYFGQCALLLDHPEASFHPFYALVPPPALYPMVALSTIAAIIASQALISGAFSLTQQAIQLGFSPRVHIVHTSVKVKGQIYIPSINYALMFACLILVLSFKESSRLAGAYGMAVTATMNITSLLLLIAMVRIWHWPLWKALPPVALFLCFDVSYFSANLFKFLDGGWIALVVALLVATVFTSWTKGREELRRQLYSGLLPLNDFLTDLEHHPLGRVRGTAVFMTISSEGTPPTLLHHVKHNHMLHEHVVLLTIRAADTPTVADEDRLRIERLPSGFYRLVAWYGYMETPNVPKVMRLAACFSLPLEPTKTTYYLGRETLLTAISASPPTGWSNWEPRFAFNLTILPAFMPAGGIQLLFLDGSGC